MWYYNSTLNIKKYNQYSSSYFAMLTINSILNSLTRLTREWRIRMPHLNLPRVVFRHPSQISARPADIGSVFCGKCIRESIRKCNHECPTCRFPIATHRSCRQDPPFDRMVGSYHMHKRKPALEKVRLVPLRLMEAHRYFTNLASTISNWTLNSLNLWTNR